jgi:Pectate lyase superfamily protein
LIRRDPGERTSPVFLVERLNECEQFLGFLQMLGCRASKICGGVEMAKPARLFKESTPGAKPSGSRMLSILALVFMGLAIVLVSCVLTAPVTRSVTAASSKAPAAAVPPPASSYDAHLVPGPIALPSGFMRSVKDFGAVGDGVADDTAAIQKALNEGRSDPAQDYYGRPSALYFPAGTYLVSDTLHWVGCCMTLQGAGSSTSIIRLAPGSHGFGDKNNKRSLIFTPQGTESFHQNLWDLGLQIGGNNAGATALNYVSNNSGSVHNVRISSDDGNASTGIDLTRQFAGPLLIKNVEIRGFDVGIDLLNSEYSITIEGIALAHQNQVAIRNTHQNLSILGMQSDNSVPAILNYGGFVVLLNAVLSGGISSTAAIQTDSTFYLRNVSSSGYATTLHDISKPGSNDIPGTIAEYLVGTPQALISTPQATSLKLNIADTPSYSDSSLSNWAAFHPAWYGDTSTLQALLNSGASTIYFPFGTYFSYAEAAVTVPDSVKRIVGFSSIMNGSPEGPNGGGVRFVIHSNSSVPLIIEQFGYGMKIEHDGQRPIAIKDGLFKYVSSPGAGNLFLEDVELGSPTGGPVVFQAGQQVWARQFNVENSGPKISNHGGSLWVLGIKTEQAGTVIDTRTGGQTEVLGGLLYPATAVPPTDAAFRSTNAQVSYMYTEAVHCPGCGYSIQVIETRGANTVQLRSDPSAFYRLPLYVGFH